MGSEFPKILPNGSLILAWQVKNRHVLVIGGGEVAASRIYHLLNADAKITVIAPSINEEIMHRKDQGLLHAVHLRAFKEDDLLLYESGFDKPILERFDEDEYAKIDEYIASTQFQLVLVAIDDPIESKKIYYQCKLRNLQVNIADVPPLCDFYFGAIFRKGDLQIMVSTNGNGPRMARLIKDKIGNLFDEYEIDKTIKNIGRLRKLLRAKCKGDDPTTIKKRMDWMLKVTDSYSFKEWSLLDNAEDIIEYFPENPPSYEVLSLNQLKVSD